MYNPKMLLMLGVLLVTSSLFAFNDSQDVVYRNVLETRSPSWTILEKMNTAERENSLIQIETGLDSKEVLRHAKEVEDAWNQGNYDNAIELMKGYEDLQNAAIGIQWKVPVITSSKWAEDIQVGTEDSIYIVDMEMDNATGHLFSVLVYQQGTKYIWEIYMSQDTGRTWAATYTWSSGGYLIRDVNIAVQVNKLYVAYSYNYDSTLARIRRMNTSDGSVDNVYSYKNAFSDPSGIREIALTSDVDGRNYYLFYFAIVGDDTLKHYWSDTVATVWNEFNPGIGNASRGLDAAISVISLPAESIWASYISTADSLNLISGWGTWTLHKNLFDVYASPYANTSIGVYGDTVMCVFPYYSTKYEVRYRVSYNSGATWAWGYIGEDSLRSIYKVDITGRGGDGFAVFYQSSGASAQGLYRHRTYAYSLWTGPDTVADFVTRFNVAPDVERVGTGIYGVLYVNYPEERAYFDGLDLTGISETPDFHTGLKLLGTSMVNRNVSIRYQLSTTANVKIVIYDLTGREVLTLLDEEKSAGVYTVIWNGKNQNGSYVPNGIYFFRITSGNSSVSGKTTVIR